MITPNFHFKNLGTILINKTFAGPIRTLQTKTLYSQTQWSHFHAPKNKTWWTRLPVVSRKRMPTPLVKDLDQVLDSYMEEGNTVAQDIIGNLRSLLTEVNHAGAMISRAASVYTDEVPANGIAGLLSDP